jgi:hypothetical protein
MLDSCCGAVAFVDESAEWVAALDLSATGGASVPLLEVRGPRVRVDRRGRLVACCLRLGEQLLRARRMALDCSPRFLRQPSAMTVNGPIMTSTRSGAGWLMLALP